MDIEKIKNKLLIKYPFFGRVISNVKYKEEESVQTAATDGKVIYYSKNFMDTLDDSEKLFVFAHEVCHIAFNHILRSKDKDEQLWNIATDAVINAFLKNDGLKVVKGAVDINGAIKCDSEELYEILKNDKENLKNNYSVGGHDNHKIWKNAIQNNMNNSNEEEHKISEKRCFKENLNEKRKALEKLKENLSSSSISENKKNIHLSNIGTSKSPLDWRYLLKENCKCDVDWSYQNAYIENGVLMPTLERYFYCETEIVLDTSGSINEELLKSFLRECKNILNASKIKVGCFDTRFYGFKEINSKLDIDNMTFEGGGGTNFDVAVKAFTNRCDNKIIFTDGYANMPQKSVDAIWMVFGNIEVCPPGGKVIYIKEDMLTKSKRK